MRDARRQRRAVQLARCERLFQSSQPASARVGVSASQAGGMVPVQGCHPHGLCFEVQGRDIGEAHQPFGAVPQHAEIDVARDTSDAVAATRRDHRADLRGGERTLKLASAPVVRAGQEAVFVEHAPVELHTVAFAEESNATECERPVERARGGDDAYGRAGLQRRGNHQ
jgi:hypothetical protein